MVSLGEMMQKIIHLLALSFILLNAKLAFSQELFDAHFNDYAENLADAQDAGKDGVFLFFFMDDCPFCQKMERQVLNQPDVINFYKKHFLNYKVNTESDLEVVNFHGDDTMERIFAKRHNLVGATPVLAFFDLEGNRVVRRTGFANKKEFMLLAKYMIDKSYLEENFVRYKRKHK